VQERNSIIVIHNKLCLMYNVDVKELNDVLRINGHTKVDEDDDNDKINVEDCDEDEYDDIDEKIDNFD